MSLGGNCINLVCFKFWDFCICFPYQPIVASSMLLVSTVLRMSICLMTCHVAPWKSIFFNFLLWKDVGVKRAFTCTATIQICLLGQFDAIENTMLSSYVLQSAGITPLKGSQNLQKEMITMFKCKHASWAADLNLNNITHNQFHIK